MQYIKLVVVLCQMNNMSVYINMIMFLVFSSRTVNMQMLYTLLYCIAFSGFCSDIGENQQNDQKAITEKRFTIRIPEFNYSDTCRCIVVKRLQLSASSFILNEHLHSISSSV